MKNKSAAAAVVLSLVSTSAMAEFTGGQIDSLFSSSTLHFVYHLDDATSFGLFTGRDVVGDADSSQISSANINGVEAGTEFGTAEVEGYIAAVTGGDEDAALFGADARYAFSNGMSAVAEAEFGSSDSIDFNRIAIGAGYRLNNGPDLYAQVGRRTADVGEGQEDSVFIEIGAAINFGTQRGTTFGPRSLFELLPNF